MADIAGEPEVGLGHTAHQALAASLSRWGRRHQRAGRTSIRRRTARRSGQGGRAGETFHNAGGRGGRTVGAKRSILIEILGLPLAVRVDPAKPNDVRVGRRLIAGHLAELPDVRAIVADRRYGGLRGLASAKGLTLA